MKFLGRAISGLFLALITLVLIGMGIWRLQSAGSENTARRGQPIQERTYNVDVAALRTQRVVPTITAYGTISAWRMLEVRPAQAGPIVEISPNFRSGATAQADELLFRVDPADFEQRVSDAEVALAQAQADQAEARDTLPLSRAEVKNAQRQLALRRADLNRKRGLKGKGFVAQGSLDEARIAVTVAEQSLNSKRIAAVAANARLRARDLAVQRTEIALANAKKALAETEFRAPFAGALTDISANLGKRLNPNERLGVLIDPASLEVSFSVTDAQFGRLLAEDGTLKPLTVSAVLDLGEQQLALNGVLDRSSSVTDLAAGGRTLFARLTPGQSAPIRPGDFVTVQIQEEPIDDVVAVPVLAASDDGEILLLTDDNRLEAHQANVVRRQDDVVVLSSVPVGREYVTARQPFLAAGVLVRPMRRGEKPVAQPTALALSDERREKLRSFIEGRKGLPPEIKERILKALARPKVPTKMVNRIEARMKSMGLGAGASQ